MLEAIGFTHSKIDHSVYYCENLIFLFYVNDGIFIFPHDGIIDKAIQDVITTGLDIQDEGDLLDHVGVNIQHHTNGNFTFTQEALIHDIIKGAHLTSRKIFDTAIPAPSSKTLQQFPDSANVDNRFEYRSLIGKLNYVGQCMHL